MSIPAQQLQTEIVHLAHQLPSSQTMNQKQVQATSNTSISGHSLPIAEDDKPPDTTVDEHPHHQQTTN